MALLTTPPSSVSALVQTTDNILPNLRPSSFQAIVSLEELPAGLHAVPIQIHTGAPRVRILNIDPAVLDLELAPIITKTMPVVISVPDQESLSPAYQVVGPPLALPDQIQLSGAAPLVERVSQVEAELLLNNTNAPIKRVRTLKAVDDTGREVSGVNIAPAQVEVSILIQRQLNARNVGVRPVTSGIPLEGYRLSALSVTPTSVTLQGDPAQLSRIGSYVDTLPVDISQATGDLNLQVPLALPPDVQALDSKGDPMRTVTVQVQIATRNSYVLVSRPVELLGITADITATVNPATVDLVMTGPAPIISQIEKEPGLVRVLVDMVGVDPPQRLTRPLTVAAPDEIRVQVIPNAVQVTLLP
jgi:YbbR domain-containing protein